MQLAPRQLDLFRQGTKPRPAPVAPAPAPEPAPALQPPSKGETLGRARELAQAIAEHIGPALKVLLTLHDNRSTMVSYRRQPPVLRLRLHHMFLDAPPHVVAALADYTARGHREAGQLIDDYIAVQQERIRVLPRRGTEFSTRGRCFDLADIFARLNQLHFQDGIRARIGWGRHTGKRRRKSIRLGVYDHKSREIRVHPVLDRPDVPLFFIEFIVFHEMLHQLFPSDRHSGRHVHHPKAFRDREKAFPKYDVAMAWEREHLKQLLSG